MNMLETLYSQLITDIETNSIKVHDDKKGVTHTTFYRDDCKIIIRHRADEFYSCVMIAK